MTKRKQLYEGKAKVIFEGPEAGTLVQYFKDDATAFNAQKKDVIKGKGVLNNYISEHIMTAVGDLGIPNHLITRLNNREQLIRKVEIISIEVVVRNVAAGSICPRLGLEEGAKLDNTLIKVIKKRTNLVQKVLSLKENKKEIVDQKRINKILSNIKRKSLINNIDPKITRRIWLNMIYAYIDFERRNFKKK